jgi:mannose-6-phosphate isomerase-like protein (cupin superfamily)
MRLSAAVSLLAFMLPVSVAAVSAAYAENVGEATRVQTFAYQTPPQAGRTPLYRLNPVVRNATLQTVPNGSLEVKFTDGSMLTLGSGSTIVVDNYVYNQGGAGQQTLKMTRGVFRFVSGTIPKDRVQLQTPMVTIGIRGTTVKTQIDETNTEVIFFEHGEGSVLINGTGKSFNMKQGDMLEIGPGGQTNGPTNRAWLAGDAAVDYGMNPFGHQDGGPGAGSTGGDGAGSAGGEGSGNN